MLPSQPQVGRISGGHSVRRGTHVPSPAQPARAQYSVASQSAFELHSAVHTIVEQLSPGWVQIPQLALQHERPGAQEVGPQGVGEPPSIAPPASWVPRCTRVQPARSRSEHARRSEREVVMADEAMWPGRAESVRAAEKSCATSGEGAGSEAEGVSIVAQRLPWLRASSTGRRGARRTLEEES